MVRRIFAPGVRWYEHCEKEHPGLIWDCVRNLSGTAYMCCVGDCQWSVGVKRG